MSGSVCLVMAHIVHATNDVLIKVSRITILQLLICKHIIQLIIAIVWWNLKTPNTANHWYGDQPFIVNIWIRGITYSLAIVFQWYAIINLPLGDAYCIQIQAPLLIAILAAIFLKETLPKTTAIIATSATVGVTFISQPTFLTKMYHHNSESVEPLAIDGIVAMIIGVTLFSISVVMIRVAKESHFLQLEIVMSLQSIWISSPILMVTNAFIIRDDRIGDFHPEDWNFDAISVAIVFMLGIFGFMALSLNVIAFQYADATKIAWLEYSTIIFGFLYQIFVFEDIPNRFETIGAALVLVACSLSLLEELYKHYKEKKSYVYHIADQTDKGEMYDSESQDL